jgi:hypothetical protein
MMIVLKTHNQYLKTLVLDRTEEILQEIQCNNERYRELVAEIRDVQRALTDKLTPQFQDLVDRYDEAETEQDGIVIPAVYRQGFLDGVKTVQLLTRMDSSFNPQSFIKFYPETYMM